MARYDNWPDKAQAAQQIGISVKTLERMVSRGKMEQRLREREGARPIAVLNPRDVERKASERAAALNKPFVLPPEAEKLEQITRPVQMPSVDEQQFFSGIRVLVESLAPKLLPPVQKPQKHLLTVREAMELGYPRNWLRQQIREGKLTRFGSKVSVFELEKLAGR